jgi:hypothetical protein
MLAVKLICVTFHVCLIFTRPPCGTAVHPETFAGYPSRVGLGTKGVPVKKRQDLPLFSNAVFYGMHAGA